MAYSDHYIKLANGSKISPVGFGTGTKWFKTSNPDVADEKTVEALVTALEAGQYHIDTAEIYNTHIEVATALKRFFAANPSVKREDLWITDKFTPKSLSPLKVVNETLKELGTSYLDLYLIHTPFLKKLAETDDISLKQVWQEIEQLYEEGKIKNIGVSNFRPQDLDELLSFAKHKPVVNQIEFSLVLQNQSKGIYDYAQKHGIVLAAYSPLAPIYKASGPDYAKLSSKLEELAKKYNKTTAQIALRWVNQRNVIIVTTSAKKQRIIESLDIFDFELSKEEVEELTKLGEESPEVRQYWEGLY
ncbi:aldo-keto reductase superfamily protein [Saccharomycopsis crataegensis]|uniref:Aldo-keto reductase superfamily protein n=1 Tax=Saccharomycopsis crataegensis TaxID=43959 RepID=A0AAV5QPJ5_9ASCO|nr:aldo-keto reductase superfamily protein [Saccharomycopsis crataegensis]